MGRKVESKGEGSGDWLPLVHPNHKLLATERLFFLSKLLLHSIYSRLCKDAYRLSTAAAYRKNPVLPEQTVWTQRSSLIRVYTVYHYYLFNALLYRISILVLGLLQYFFGCPNI